MMIYLLMVLIVWYKVDSPVIFDLEDLDNETDISKARYIVPQNPKRETTLNSSFSMKPF